MICRKLYAHKGSILLNSGSDHGKPRRFFFFGSSLERILYVIPVMAGIVSGRSRMVQKRQNKKAFRRAGPNFERPLLRAICFFCGVFKKGYSIPPGGSTAAVPGRTGEMCGLWACHKIHLENHQQLESKRKRKRKLMRSGGISDEDALNRPFPFTLGVNNPNESDI
jgi:hypothetical protein